MYNPNNHTINLKGKKYLPVAERLVWFREDKPNWRITTSLLANDATSMHAIFKAEISNENGHVLATGHGSESVKDFRDYLEKAETKAIGRALGILGYGTQFAPEFDEGQRIVDTPQPSIQCDFCGKTITREQAIKTYKEGKKKLCNDCNVKK